MKIERVYDDNNNLVFEGEIKDGKWNGKGKIYHKNKKIAFEGNFLEGKLQGKIIVSSKDSEEIEELSYSNGIKIGM